MSGIRAFMKRDWFTCDQCMSLEFHGFQPYCAYNKREIRWQLKQFGCGHFAENDKEYEKREWRMRHDCLTDTDKAEMAKERERSMERWIAQLPKGERE